VGGGAYKNVGLLFNLLLHLEVSPPLPPPRPFWLSLLTPPSPWPSLSSPSSLWVVFVALFSSLLVWGSVRGGVCGSKSLLASGGRVGMGGWSVLVCVCVCVCVPGGG
jgi:hypothetical protein